MPIRVLLVDDDEDEHLFFTVALAQIPLPVQLTSADTGSQAIRTLNTDRFDIIFLDINMPGMDGYKCLDNIRKAQPLSDIPVYLYSTGVDAYVEKEARRRGASGCLKKLHDIPALAEAVQSILETVKTPH